MKQLVCGGTLEQAVRSQHLSPLGRGVTGGYAVKSDTAFLVLSSEATASEETFQTCGRRWSLGTHADIRMYAEILQVHY